MASTPEVDRQGDLLELAGVTFRNPIPLLVHHDQTSPIGKAILTITPAGITFDAELATVDEPGPFKTLADDTWQRLTAGVLSGASIGFRILDGAVERLKAGGRRILKSEICELSLVTIPANQNATIRLIKSLALERSRPAMNLTTTERIAALELKRDALAARLAGMLDASAVDDQPMTDDQATTYDALALELKALDGDLGRWRDRESLNVAAAKPVPPTPSRYAPAITVKSNLPKGTAFVRAVCAQYLHKGDMRDAIDYAEKRWGRDNPEVALHLKAAVAAGTTTDPIWAKPLVNQNVSTELIELVRPATFLGQIKGFKKVPFNTKMPRQTNGGTYNWVGEAKPKPVTSLGFDTVALDMSKIAGIIALTKELAMLSNPDAEQVVRNDMIAGIAKFSNQQFIDPAVALVAGVHPASITNGAPTAPATADPLADILGLIRYFTANGISIAGVTFLLSPGNALALAVAKGSDGSTTFPGLSVSGGSYLGMDFIASELVGDMLIALQPSYILYAEDGGVEIDVSQEATLQMDSAPASPPIDTTVMVSLWQTNQIGIRAERFINWNKINPNAVRYLTAAVYPVTAGAGGATATSKK